MVTGNEQSTDTEQKGSQTEDSFTNNTDTGNGEGSQTGNVFTSNTDTGNGEESKTGISFTTDKEKADNNDGTADEKDAGQQDEQENDQQDQSIKASEDSTKLPVALSGVKKTLATDTLATTATSVKNLDFLTLKVGESMAIAPADLTDDNQYKVETYTWSESDEYVSANPVEDSSTAVLKGLQAGVTTVKLTHAYGKKEADTSETRTYYLTVEEAEETETKTITVSDTEEEESEYHASDGVKILMTIIVLAALAGGCFYYRNRRRAH